MGMATEQPVRVVSLTAENFKRLKAIRIKPNGEGVTRIVGKNEAGKTSVLDAIAVALGGPAHKVDAPIRKGSKRAEVVVDLDSFIVRRKWSGDKTELEITNKEGDVFSSPQAMLDKFLGSLSFDPLEFSRMKPKDQAAVLASVAGVDLEAFQQSYNDVFATRTSVNKQHKEQLALLKNIPEIDAPDKEVSINQVLADIEAAEEKNKAAEVLANKHKEALKAETAAKLEKERAKRTLDDYEANLVQLKAAVAKTEDAHTTAVAASVDAGNAAVAADKVDIVPLREICKKAEETNRQVRARAARKAKAEAAYALEEKSDNLSKKLKALVEERDAAIAAAKLPIDGLKLGEDGVLFNDLPLGSASAAALLRVSTAIGLALNPKLKLMLIRDGSLLDESNMKLMSEMAEAAGAQILIERVENPGEVGILISDGEVVEQKQTDEAA
jgi:hypothetical protein